MLAFWHPPAHATRRISVAIFTEYDLSPFDESDPDDFRPRSRWALLVDASVAGAHVEVILEGETKTAVTDHFGDFKIDGLKRGARYALRARRVIDARASAAGRASLNSSLTSASRLRRRTATPFSTRSSRRATRRRLRRVAATRPNALMESPP